jgi:hypothetical protein
MQCELSAEARNDLAAMAYNKWREAFENVQKVKAEKYDGSPDWELLHRERLNNALNNRDRAQRVLDEIKKYAPIIVGS